MKLDPRHLDNELEELRARLRQVEAMNDGDGDKRREKARRDFRFFCDHYLAHYIEDDPSQFHTWSFCRIQEMQPGCKEAVAAPRGNAKTTLWARAQVLWRIVRCKLKNVVVIQDTALQAAQTIETVRMELEDNPRLAEDFPTITGPGRTWRQGRIVTRNDIQVSGIGSGQPVRGLLYKTHRPDLVIIDDLENDELVQSRARRDKLYRWFTSAVLPVGPPDGSMMLCMIGTVLHSDSVLMRVSRRADFRFKKFQAVLKFPDDMNLWERWEAWALQNEELGDQFYARNKADMDQGAEVLWPGVQPLLLLMKLRLADRRAFAQEYQNEAGDPERKPFKREKMWFYRDVPRIVRAVGFVDLALGKARSDDTAIIVLGRCPEGIAYVLEAAIKRYTPEAAAEKIVQFQRVWNCARWGVEEVNFQILFKTLLLAVAAREEVAVPAVGQKPVGPKELRIDSLVPHVENGLIRFSQQHTVLLDQLTEWEPESEAEKDDGPDGLEGAFRLLGSGVAPSIKTPGTARGGFGRLVGLFKSKRGF